MSHRQVKASAGSWKSSRTGDGATIPSLCYGSEKGLIGAPDRGQPCG
jgi:hypothetical protein